MCIRDRDGTEARFPTFDGIEKNLNLDLFNKLTGSSSEQKSLQSEKNVENFASNFFSYWDLLGRLGTII